MQHIEECLDKYEKLRHRHYWWNSAPICDVKQEEMETDICSDYYDRMDKKHMLLVCPNGDVLAKRKKDSLMWAEMLFTDELWIQGGFKF